MRAYRYPISPINVLLIMSYFINCIAAASSKTTFCESKIRAGQFIRHSSNYGQAHHTTHPHLLKPGEGNKTPNFLKYFLGCHVIAKAELKTNMLI